MASEDPFAEFVSHPRFGKRPIESCEVVPTEFYRGRRRFPWQEGWIFPESAILADVSRQTPCPVPLQAYVDHRVDCRTCGRPFLFFAREQKHWYEDLQFNLSASCVDCPECRKQNQRTRRHLNGLRRRYEELLAKGDELDDAGWIELAQVSADMFRDGLLKQADKVRWALNRVRDRTAHASTIDRIKELIATEP